MKFEFYLPNLAPKLILFIRFNLSINHSFMPYKYVPPKKTLSLKAYRPYKTLYAARRKCPYSRSKSLYRRRSKPSYLPYRSKAGLLFRATSRRKFPSSKKLWTPKKTSIPRSLNSRGIGLTVGDRFKY